MPTTPMKNLLYRLALPLAPSPRGQMRHETFGRSLNTQKEYERILIRHHVLGASLLLDDPVAGTSLTCTSVETPRHIATEETMFRVASITKMATALVTLMMVDDGAFTLDTPVDTLLPDAHGLSALAGITVKHLLCHTSGLRDIPAYDLALKKAESYHAVLNAPGVRVGQPGEEMAYCNFGFGLLGCILEQTSGLDLEQLFQRRLFEPLGMRATLNAATLDVQHIMPISRVLPYHAGRDTLIPPLGRVPLNQPDPLRHFGYTAGAMYTDGRSLLRLLQLIGHQGAANGRQLISKKAMACMTTLQASTSIRSYGLGLVLLNRPNISPNRLLGHQGFAYGCVDGAFIEEQTGRSVVFLNGGASEARAGRLGLVNQAVLTWAIQKEFPSWT